MNKKSGKSGLIAVALLVFVFIPGSVLLMLYQVPFRLYDLAKTKLAQLSQPKRQMSTAELLDSIGSVDVDVYPRLQAEPSELVEVMKRLTIFGAIIAILILWAVFGDPHWPG